MIWHRKEGMVLRNGINWNKTKIDWLVVIRIPLWTYRRTHEDFDSAKVHENCLARKYFVVYLRRRIGGWKPDLPRWDKFVSVYGVDV